MNGNGTNGRRRTAKQIGQVKRTPGRLELDPISLSTSFCDRDNGLGLFEGSLGDLERLDGLLERSSLPRPDALNDSERPVRLWFKEGEEDSDEEDKDDESISFNFEFESCNWRNGLEPVVDDDDNDGGDEEWEDWDGVGDEHPEVDVMDDEDGEPKKYEG